MEKKKIVVDNIEFEFFLDENSNMWRLLENPNLLTGNTLDIEIDVKKVRSPDWTAVAKFIDMTRRNDLLLSSRIEDAKTVLSSLFRAINKNVYDDNFLENIDFRLTGVDFMGFNEQVNIEDTLVYDLFFYPIYKLDEYRDIGSFVWRANCRDLLLLGVHCDRL